METSNIEHRTCAAMAGAATGSRLPRCGKPGARVLRPLGEI
ncbi:MAG TPA: hypothetical protein VFW05_08910 [Verrucomicrobiae bacterium]|nr:hypothetical protein [Verrucomicrobiae bacterium]